jgi:hypothetical protein
VGNNVATEPTSVVEHILAIEMYPADNKSVEMVSFAQ